MKKNWLVVSELGNTKIKTELVRTIFATGKKARELAIKYQMELHGGLTEEQAHISKIKNNTPFFVVTACPWSDIREYRREIVDVIEFAPEYK